MCGLRGLRPGEPDSKCPEKDVGRGGKFASDKCNFASLGDVPAFPFLFVGAYSDAGCEGMSEGGTATDTGAPEGPSIPPEGWTVTVDVACGGGGAAVGGTGGGAAGPPTNRCEVGLTLLPLPRLVILR